ncbi:MAG: hypothetical protein ACNA8W_09330, partial [Bradymonadaceae bacterium]
FCLGILVTTALAFVVPCLCTTAFAAQSTGAVSSCCPEGGEKGEESECGCGCSDIQGDEGAQFADATAQAVIQDHEDLAIDPVTPDAAVKALLFVWFAQFVEASFVDQPPPFESPPLLASKTTNFLDLRVLRL